MTRHRCPAIGDRSGATVVACRFANDAAGQAALLSGLAAAGPDRSGAALLVIEASGGTGQGLLSAAWAVGQKVALVAAQRVRHFARSLGQHAKTDRIDARILARCRADHTRADRAIG